MKFCGPCSLHWHDDCRWHDGENCDCSCHAGMVRYEARIEGALRDDPPAADPKEK